MSAVTVGDGQLRSERHSKTPGHVDQYESTVLMCDETHQIYLCRPEFVHVFKRGVVMDACRPTDAGSLCGGQVLPASHIT